MMLTFSSLYLINCVIMKPHYWEGPGPLLAVAPCGKGGERNRLNIRYIESCLNTCIMSVHFVFYVDCQSLCLRCI